MLGESLRSQCRFWVQGPIGGVVGVAGSPKSTDDKQQERQLSTPGTPRRLRIKSWLHHFLTVSFFAHDLTFLGL